MRGCLHDRSMLLGRMLCILALSCSGLILTGNAICQAQPPPAITPKNEDTIDRRRLLELLSELQTIRLDQLLQASHAFDQAWAIAVTQSDPLLNLSTKEQQILEPGQSQLDAGARARLQHIYENAPRQFRKAYEEQIATTAQKAMTQATEGSRIDDLLQVILRYQFTSVGQQALKHLIQIRLSRGEFLEAALQYGRLLRLQRNDDPGARVRLAVMWWKAGLPEEAADHIRDIVIERPSSRVIIDGVTLTLPNTHDDLSLWLKNAAVNPQNVGGDSTVAADWAQPLGNYRRTGTRPVGPPILQSVWSQPSFSCVERIEFNPLLEAVSHNLERELDAVRDMNNTVIPVAAPLQVGDLLIFRSAANIRAVDRRSGEVAWESFQIDRQLMAAQESWRRADDDHPVMLATLRPQMVNHWLRANVGGQLTCDGRTVFAVEEATDETMRLDLDSKLPPIQIPTNYLRAYDVDGGVLRGQAGGPAGNSSTGGKVNPLTGRYFLGAPLLMGDRIYVIAEHGEGIFLLQLRATPLYAAADGEVDMRPVRSQLLSIPRHAVRNHPLRKYAGIIPSYGRGLLICNTCDEQVVAISAEDHSVRWIYRYPTNVVVPELNPNIAVIGSAFSPAESDSIDMTSRWTDSLPRIVDNRVLLTPRDCDRLLCLDLQTGKELWSRPRGALRNIAAVTHDRVILAGSLFVECLDLATGNHVWTTNINSGRISGNAVSDGRVLQVPTSAPAVITLDLQTGRYLLAQQVESTPGNLLSTDGELFSQSVTSVSCFTADSAQPPAPLLAANRHLLAGEIAAAETALKAVIADGSVEDHRPAEQLLIHTLLESIRIDYPANANRVPEVQQLIDASSPTEEQIVDGVQAMLGMTLVDAATLPILWNEINRSKQQSGLLQSLAAEGQLLNLNEAPEVLSERILQMMEQLLNAGPSYVTAGNIVRKNFRGPAAAIRSAMNLRPDDVGRSVRQFVNAGIQDRIEKLATPEETQAWLELCLLTGFLTPVVEATTNTDVPVPPETAGAFRDLALMMLIESTDLTESTQALDLMLQTWRTDDRWLTLANLFDRTQERVTTKAQLVLEQPLPVNIRDHGILPEKSVRPDSLQQLRDKPADELPAVPWQGTPVVSESPARTSLTIASGDDGAVHSDIPLFGTPGTFGGWTFLQQRPHGNRISAFDQAGRLRWTFDAGDFSVRSDQRFQDSGSSVSAQYLLACGNLLAMKIHHMLFVLDCGNATAAQPPKLLWELDISAALEAASRSQLYIPAWERTTQYDMQPSGMFPIGPLTPYGIPVYSGRQLVMLNTFSGEREWQVAGLPGDCRLTATDDELLLISESVGQVEVRGLIDGAVKTVTALPLWWTDASENSNASVYTFEPEPGEELRFRIAVQQGGCLLLRRNTEASALEWYNLRSGTTEWSIPLAADSLVSNIVDGHVAVLSDSNRLQIYNTMQGTQITDVDVPAAPDGMYLYLRSSGRQWIVVTDVFDPEHDEQNPAGDSVIVSGQVYSVSQQNGGLTWSTAIEHEWLRVLRPQPKQGPLPPTAPFLVLLKRPYPDRGPNGLRVGPVVYKVKVVDVRSGDMLYEDDDVGRSLSFFWTRLNADKNTIELSFDKRIVTFDYSGKDKPPEVDAPKPEPPQDGSGPPK